MTLRLAHRQIVVAVPVKDEAERIAGCLRAMARQDQAAATKIVLVLNNCRDNTMAVVRDVSPTLPVPVEVIACALPPGLANAGYARRIAMERAADGMTDGVVLTTDADGRVARDWIAANLRALQGGVDAVAGRAIIDPDDARLIPARLHEDDARECAYSDLLDEIAALLDPQPWDPWPRHAEHSGASIAVTAQAYRAAGGMPAVPLGEDRAFFEALRRIDARIRHCCDVRVTVSGRTRGRAAGGMADTIRRRLERSDEWLDDRLEPPARAVARARLRAAARRIWREGGNFPSELSRLARSLRLPMPQLRELLKSEYFGDAWAEIEIVSPALQRFRVAAADVVQAINQATAIRDGLRAGRAVRTAAVSQTAPADQDGSAAPGIAAVALAGGDSSPRMIELRARRG